MKDKNKKPDPIPESFATEEEAGEFWDTHSTADYEEYLERVDMTMQKRSDERSIALHKEIAKKLRSNPDLWDIPVNCVRNCVFNPIVYK
jgi:hypothetical protein